MLAFLGIGLFHPVLESPTLFIIYGLGCGLGYRNTRAQAQGGEGTVVAFPVSQRSELVPEGPSSWPHPARQGR
jgi:hypothetical protein